MIKIGDTVKLISTDINVLEDVFNTYIPRDLEEQECYYYFTAEVVYLEHIIEISNKKDLIVTRIFNPWSEFPGVLCYELNHQSSLEALEPFITPIIINKNIPF